MKIEIRLTFLEETANRSEIQKIKKKTGSRF